VPGDLEQPLAEEEHHPGIARGTENPGRWPGPARRGRSGGCGPGRRAAAGSGCSCKELHATISAPRRVTPRSRRTHTCLLRSSRSGLWPACLLRRG
jgi:hypothetical protein